MNTTTTTPKQPKQTKNQTTPAQWSSNSTGCVRFEKSCLQILYRSICLLGYWDLGSQQLMRTRGCCWADWTTETSPWRDPPCMCVCMPVYILTSGPPSCSARQGRRTRLLALSVFLWVLWASVMRVPGHGYMWSMHVPCVCACWEYIFSFAIGRIWSGMELQHPQLSGRVRYFSVTFSHGNSSSHCNDSGSLVQPGAVACCKPSGFS